MDVNRVFVAGRFTKDPELKDLPSGEKVCNFGVAINRRWRDADTNEEREAVCFVDVASFGKRAVAIKQHFHKGKSIFIEGRLRMDQWEQDGKTRTKHLIVLENFHFVGPRTGEDASSDDADTDEPEEAMAPSPSEPARAAAVRRKREKVLAAAGAGIDPAQVPF